MGQGNSPNKRQRLTPPNNMTGANQMQMQGQPQNGMHPQGVNLMSNAAQAQYLRQQGVTMPQSDSQQELVNIARQNVQAGAPGMQQLTGPKAALSQYRQGLQSQQAAQGLARPGLGVGGGSPANQAAQIPGNPDVRAPTNAEIDALQKQAAQYGGTLRLPPGSSGSLSDYQNQLMVLEQQNKKRLQSARSESGVRDESGGANFAGQFPNQQGQGLQAGHPQIQGTSMSPSNSRAGPSPRMGNLELQQRKAAQKAGSQGASPESTETAPIAGPSPGFPALPPGMTIEQYQQQMPPNFPHAMLMNQNGQHFAGRPPPAMYGQPQTAAALEAMKARMAPGQPFPQQWQQQVMMNQALNQAC
jgi:hypothetical protein